MASDDRLRAALVAHLSSDGAPLFQDTLADGAPLFQDTLAVFQDTLAALEHALVALDHRARFGQLNSTLLDIVLSGGDPALDRFRRLQVYLIRHGLIEVPECLHDRRSVQRTVARIMHARDDLVF
jgi:hypothetical protein